MKMEMKMEMKMDTMQMQMRLRWRWRRRPSLEPSLSSVAITQVGGITVTLTESSAAFLFTLGDCLLFSPYLDLQWHNHSYMYDVCRMMELMKTEMTMDTMKMQMRLRWRWRRRRRPSFEPSRSSVAIIQVGGITVTLTDRQRLRTLRASHGESEDSRLE